MPVFYERKYVEWQDRGEGRGAPVAIHNADSDIVSTTTRDKSFKDRLPNGNYLENTANHFVVVLGDNPQTALISMKATQLKISRKWNSIMMGIKMPGKNGLFTPPTYSHIYNLKTVQMSNDKGTWFGWEVSKVGPVTDKNVYGVAKGFAERLGKGEVQVKHGNRRQTGYSILIPRLVGRAKREWIRPLLKSQIFMNRFKEYIYGIRNAHGCHGVTFVDKKGVDGEKIKGKSFVKREPVTDNMWLSHLQGRELKV